MSLPAPHAAALAPSPEAPPAHDGFALAPVPLWLEDFSGVKTLLDAWRRAGVTEIAGHLASDPALTLAASRRIRVLQVNDRALELFEAPDFEILVANLDRVFRDEMLVNHASELCQLWDGRTAFTSQGVNYTLSGRRLDIQLKGRVLPGHEDDWARVLVSTEDVTERETARRASEASDAYAKGLFEHSPISLWVEDFSVVKALLDEVRASGVRDFRTFTDVHPEFVGRCMSEIRVIDVNRHTLELFRARDKRTLLHRLDDVFRGAMEGHFREQLADLWNGKLFQTREVVNYALDGEELHVHLQFSVLPGHEADWSLVQVALTDITARKKAEAYLEYLGKHDTLTRLYNRAFFVDEMNRLERKGPKPVTVVVADLNGLKTVNDALGHAAGDALLRRAGEVFNEAVRRPAHAARIGGDEFVVLMPASDEADGAAMVEALQHYVEMNNQFYSGDRLSFAFGAATTGPGERLEDAVRRADAAMYEMKRALYSQSGHDRRRD